MSTHQPVLRPRLAGAAGSRLKDMALEIRNALVPYARDGLMQEVLEGIALIACRPDEVT